METIKPNIRIGMKAELIFFSPKPKINKTKIETIKADQLVLKLIKRMFEKSIKEIKIKIIFKFPLPLNAKVREIGKSNKEKIEKAFGVPIVLKETDFAKSKGKMKIL